MTTYYNYLGQAMPVSADPGSNTVHASGAGQTITAPTGPSALYAYDTSGNSFNNDTFIGSNGDNTFYINNVTDLVQVGAGLTGVKSIVVWAGGYTLPANVQNLTFFGAGNWGAGNAGNNLIVMGGNDHATLDGGGGNDVLVGGLGGNDFQFEVGAGGHDVFYGFQPSLDTVRIAGSTFTSFAQIQSAMQQTGSDVVLTIDSNDSITFRNITIAQLQPANFLLPLDASQLGAMTFDEEFTSLDLWNGSTGKWNTNFGSDPTKLDDYAITSNNEKQLYTAPNFVGQNGWNLSAYNPFSISGGVLDITAGQFSYADSQHTWGQAYYSGMLNTRGLFQQQYGFFEMRAALPTDLGSWPAFWLSQDPYAPGTEADILEHLAMYPDVDFARAVGGGTVAGHTTYMPTLSGFHNYGMLWGPTTTTFYIDDLAVMSLPTPSSWTKPMYMILDMALGGWGGPIDATAFPAQMQVDWVHVYGLANGGGTGGGTGGGGTGGGGTGGGGTAVSTSASPYTAPSGVTDITLTGSQQAVYGNNAGDTFHSNNSGNYLYGATGNDTFDMGRGGDWATGNGGNDVFAFAATPWAPGGIADFNAGDTVDLTGLLHASGYTGSDPIGAGYIKIVDDGSGDAQIWSNLDKVVQGYGWYLVTTVEHVAPAQLQEQGDTVVMAGSTGTGGTGGTGGGGTGGTGGTGGGTSVSTSASPYTAPAGVTDITLTGSQQTITGNNAGDTFHSNNSGNYLYGGTGADTFDMGRGGDWATGGGGNDTFAFAETPWAAGGITDFNLGDKVDLTGLLARSGYTGSNAIGAGFIKITDDGSGDAQVWSNLNSTWWLVTTLQHVQASSLHMTGAFISE